MLLQMRKVLHPIFPEERRSYGGNPGLLSTEFFRLPDQKLLHIIQEIIEEERKKQ